VVTAELTERSNKRIAQPGIYDVRRNDPRVWFGSFAPEPSRGAPAVVEAARARERWRPTGIARRANIRFDRCADQEDYSSAFHPRYLFSVISGTRDAGVALEGTLILTPRLAACCSAAATFTFFCCHYSNHQATDPGCGCVSGRGAAVNSVKYLLIAFLAAL
jgi:hypothetical protein